MSIVQVTERRAGPTGTRCARRRESDTAMIESVRRGDTTAYGQLYQRHVASAYKLAHRLTRSRAEADDLVSEAFAKVLRSLLTGRGPDDSFAPTC